MYTYVVLDLATYCLHRLGLPDDHAVQYSVAALIMVVQLIIGTLGFYAIRTFEKWTVPVLAATVHGSGLIAAGSELVTAVGIGWGFSWVPWASDYSRFTTSFVIWTAVDSSWLASIVLGGSAYRLLSRPRAHRFGAA